MNKHISLFNAGRILVILVLCTSLRLAAQDPAAGVSDDALIRQTALNYIEGFYSGDAARMEKAIHPDLNKATPRDLPQTGRTALNYTTWSGLIEFTRAGIGILADSARHIGVNILDMGNDVAVVKAISANFTDYLQVVRINDEWKIINVLFASGLKTPARIKDFDPEKERPEIEKASLAYMNALSGADAGRLSQVIDPEYNRVSLVPVGQTGKVTIRRQRYENVMENALAGAGKQDETYRYNRVTVLDAFDGIAAVKCESAGATEQIQMYKGDGQWKVFNSIVRPNTAFTLQQAMTATAGEPMPDFSLPVYGGGHFTLSDYKGKNVMLIFPRGWTGQQWCAYCYYQYMEMEQLERTARIMARNDLQIAFVMPYSSDRIRDWQEKFPDAQQVVAGIKNPTPAPAEGTIQAEYAAWARQKFPLTFEVSKDSPHDLIPVLVDENHYLSRQLKLSTNFWDNVTADQNIASVFIIDKKGILRFKYIGQMTEDRPSTGYLLDYIRTMK